MNNIKVAEYVSLGHPDKTADYISSFILDHYIHQDPHVHYAVEVMIKDNTVVLGGEIKSSLDISKTNYKELITKALEKIGYTDQYSDIWGEDTINPKKLEVINLIGQQSTEIDTGVSKNGWGDQGVFVGYACKGQNNMPLALYQARRLCILLYEFAKNTSLFGLDIKTQTLLNEQNEVSKVIVAIPVMEPKDKDRVKDFIKQNFSDSCEIIINAAGDYKTHSSIADCGVTGRKLAVDFYSTAAPIGGGSPWTKDPSKADLTLNLKAREIALEFLKDNDECYCYLSSVIGVPDAFNAKVVTVKDGKTKEHEYKHSIAPDKIIDELELRKPIYSHLCRNGLLWS